MKVKIKFNSLVVLGFVGISLAVLIMNYATGFLLNKK